MGTWTGRDAHALRVALRMTIEGFAEHLGMAPRAVRKWDAEPEIVPVMATQQILDVALGKAPDEAKARFAILTAEGAEDRRGGGRASCGLDEPQPPAAYSDHGPAQATPEVLEFL